MLEITTLSVATPLALFTAELKSDRFQWWYWGSRSLAPMTSMTVDVSLVGCFQEVMSNLYCTTLTPRICMSSCHLTIRVKWDDPITRFEVRGLSKLSASWAAGTFVIS